MSTTPNTTGHCPAQDPQPKALRVAAIIRERLGIDCLAAELLESQHARIAALERQLTRNGLRQSAEPTSPTQKIPMAAVSVPFAQLIRIHASLSAFYSEPGWTLAYTDTLDELGNLLRAAIAAQGTDTP